MGLLDLIFPKKCLECGKSGSYLCVNCLQKVSQIGASGKHFAAFKYEGVVRKAIIALKYKFVFDIAEELASLFAERIKNSKLTINNTVLIPVPLHKRRENWRGFNQSEILGRLVAQKLGWGFAPKVVIRLENTIPQAHLGRQERLRNLRGKFAVNESALRSILSEVEGLNPTFVIFDDVWTTGSTIKEIESVLTKNGIKDVWGMTVAR